MTDVPALRAAVPVTIAAPVLPNSANAPAALATVSSGALPAALAQLGVGAVINGVVAQVGPRGQVVIRTDKGAISLQTPLPLRVGSAITLQIQSLGAQSQVMVLSVDSQPLSGQAANVLANNSGMAKPSASASASSPNAAQGKPLPLQDFGAPATAATTTAHAATSPAPTVLRSGVVVSGQLSPLPAAASPAASPLSPPAKLPIPVADTDSVPLRVLGVAPAPSRAAPGAPPAEAPMPRIAPGLVPADDAVTFVGTVMPNQVAGEANGSATLLRTPFGLLRLPLPVQQPPGSQVLLELLTPRAPQPLPSDRIAQDLGASRRMTALGQEWPALRDVMETLDAEAPEAVRQAAMNAVPRVGPTLTAGLLLFIAAARSGSLRQWLGDDAVETLERGGHGALAARLADDMANLPRLAETQPNGWQTLLLPIFDGDKLRQIRMSMRRARKDSSGRNDGARFIIEAELSKLGALQLDGLVRLPHFDLAVRTQDNLPPEIRANIMEIFNDAMQAAKLAGSVSFQVAREMKAGPFENWQAAGPGVTV